MHKSAQIHTNCCYFVPKIPSLCFYVVKASSHKLLLFRSSTPLTLLLYEESKFTRIVAILFHKSPHNVAMWKKQIHSNCCYFVPQIPSL